MTSANAFKVIIAGGGPVGLTAAFALSRAGIDFVMLERREEIVIDAGSNIVLLPNGMRILYQMGLGDSFDKVTSPLSDIHYIDHRGNYITDAQWFWEFKHNLGAFPRVISRHDLTDVLYNALSKDAKAKVHANKKITDIATKDDGVLVTCADGTIYSGSIIIGADGAHSTTRKFMRDIALSAGATEVNDESPYLTTYRCLWFRFPTSATGVDAGVTYETHGPGLASQLFTGADTSVVGLYQPLEKPTRERIRHKPEDQKAIIEQWGHLPLVPGQLTLRKAYDAHTQSGLVSLEEGIVDHWSYDGRIVLAGDAAHKFTPSTGAGCNNGMVDIVALANQLHKVVSEKKKENKKGTDDDGVITKGELNAAFKEYQQGRAVGVAMGFDAASNATALATWYTNVHGFLDKWVFSWAFMQRRFSTKAALKTSQMPVFDFIEGVERMEGGRMPWVNTVPSFTSAH